MVKTCNSCNKEVRENYIEFSCPRCGKEKIVRCGKCKAMSKEYTCTNCSFIGP